MARFDLRFLSKSLLRPTRVTLLIPSPDLRGAMGQSDPFYYRRRAERFPLVMLLSGFGSEGETWLSRSNIEELCDTYRVAAALVGGENRWYSNTGPMDRWQDLVSVELPDFLYGSFVMLDASRPPILGGVSMGGYGALFNGLSAPERWSAIMALSPALRPDGVEAGSEGDVLPGLFRAAADRLPPLYMSVGTEDFIIGPIRDFDGALRESVPGAAFRFVPGFGHSWDLWRGELQLFLEEMRKRKVITPAIK